MAISTYSLLTNGNATGPAFDWPGGPGVFVATGTFGGSTVSLEWSPDEGVTWLPTDRTGDTFTTLTSASAGEFRLPPSKIRARVAGGTGVSVTVVAKGF